MSRSPRFAPHALPLRRVAVLSVLAISALLLTGCVDIELKATVSSDNTVSGTTRIGISKSIASLAGGSDGLLQQLKSDDPCEFGSAKTTEKDYDDGTYIGVECSFSKMTLADFNSGNSSDGSSGPKLERVGSNFQLSGTFDLSDVASSASGSLGSAPSGSPGGTSAAPSPTALPSGVPSDLSSLLPSGFPSDLSSLLPSGLPSDLSSLLPSGFPSDLSSLLPSGLPSDLASLIPSDLASALPGASSLPSLDPKSLLSSAKVSFSFTFPGKVTSSAGTISGNTVTFTPNSEGKIDFKTVAAADGSNTHDSLGTGVWLVVVLILLALAALVVLLLRRRGRRQPPQGPNQLVGQAVGPPGYGQADQYGQPQYGQPQYGQPQDGQPQYGQPPTPGFGPIYGPDGTPTAEPYLGQSYPPPSPTPNPQNPQNPQKPTQKYPEPPYPDSPR
ncbi:LppM family (lipo)protein [Jatrophihabitans sp. DSM 45814]